MFGVPSCDEVLKISCLKFKLRDKLSLSACRGNVGLITDPGQAQDLSLSMFHVSNCSNSPIQLQATESCILRTLIYPFPPLEELTMRYHSSKFVTSISTLACPQMIQHLVLHSRIPIFSHMKKRGLLAGGVTL
jgi:hypothetical protein